MGAQIEMKPAAALLVCATLGLGACDAPPRVGFRNVSGRPLTLRFAPHADSKLRDETYSLQPGTSVVVPPGVVTDVQFRIADETCEMSYRALTLEDRAIDWRWGKKTALEVRPDLTISIRGWRTDLIFWKPARTQPPGWPLRPVSKTCR